MKNFLLIFSFFLFLINTSIALEKSEIIKKFGSLGYGSKKLDYNFGCFIDAESYDETLYNRLVETVGPYSFGYLVYNHPKGTIMLLNNWVSDDLHYNMPSASTHSSKIDDNLRIGSAILTNETMLIFNDIIFKSDKIMLYRSSYKLNKTVGNKFWKKKMKYNTLLQNSNDDALEVLEDLKFDLLEYIAKNPDKDMTIIYSCNQW